MHILIVDDEKNIRLTLRVALESMEHKVSCAPNSATALAEVRASVFDVVLLDLRLSQASGLDLLVEIVRLSPQTAVVLMTAYASIETAVEAMRRGAFDYLPKPCTPDLLRQLLGRIEKNQRLERRVAELESRLGAEPAEFTSRSHAMQKVLQIAFRAAESEATILLLGESGTGKSLLARAIHERSPRKAGAFVTVSCPSLSRELLESDLFGHVKGAFTGAHADMQGKVAAANNGTLFLDEIGELPLEIQARLLRLLQEREYERVGETMARRATVRVIAATNRDLAQAVAAGRFREDLFYRLNVISLRLPALRERMEDLDQLAGTHLCAAARQAGRNATGFTTAALEVMHHYHWPGNLRELRNIIERAVILCEADVIDGGDLTETIQPAAEVRVGGKLTLEELESEHIRRVMASTRTLEEAAAVLGIDPATLYRKRKRM